MSSVSPVLATMKAELPQHLKPIPVSWLPKQLSFYAIPITYSLVKSNLFKDGRIYGMDVSSGAAVSALLLKDHDRKCNFDDNRKIIMNRSFDNQTSLRVLDLCCAPGKWLLSFKYYYQYHIAS